MGANGRAEVRSDAVNVAAQSFLTSPDPLYQSSHPALFFVVVLGVGGSSPLAHPRELAGQPVRPPSRADRSAYSSARTIVIVLRAASVRSLAPAPDQLGGHPRTDGQYSARRRPIPRVEWERRCSAW
jgi:hypothetical protein